MYGSVCGVMNKRRSSIGLTVVSKSLGCVPAVVGYGLDGRIQDTGKRLLLGSIGIGISD